MSGGRHPTRLHSRAGLNPAAGGVERIAAQRGDLPVEVLQFPLGSSPAILAEQLNLMDKCHVAVPGSDAAG